MRKWFSATTKLGICLGVVTLGWTFFEAWPDHRKTKSAEERKLALEVSNRQLGECRIDLEELRRTRELQIQRVELNRSSLPVEVRVRMPSAKDSVIGDEVGTARRCASLVQLQKDLAQGLPTEDAQQGHLQRLTDDTIEKLKKYDFADHPK